MSAIGITIALSVCAILWSVFPFFATAASLWVVFDSRRVEFWRYHTAISGGPTVIFILLLVLGWPVVFPWYLGMRLKNLAGTARLRDEYRPWQMSDSTVGANDLVQPWRGRKL